MEGDTRRGGRTPKPYVDINRGLVAVNALSSVFTHVISIGVLLWVNQYLLKRLSPEEYAPFPIVVALFLFLQVCTAVLTGGISRYITEAYAKGDLRRVTEIVSSMVPLILVAVLCFWAFGGLVSWKVGVLLSIDPGQLGHARLMMGLMVLGHGIVLLAMPFSVGLHVRQKFVWLNLIKLGEQLLRLVLMCVFLFEISTSVHWVVVSTQIAVVTATAVTVLISRRLIPELRLERRAFRLKISKQLSSFGGWMMLGGFLNRIRTSADIIILNKLSSALDVTAFHVGRLPDRQIDALLSMVAVTMQPALIAMHAARRHESLRRAYLRGNRYFLWCTLAIAVPLFVFAEELVILYAGETYLLAALVLKLRCAAYPLSYASYMLYLVAVAKARIRPFFLIVSAGSVLHLLGAFILVRYFNMGAAGVAYAALAVAIVIQLAFLWPLGLRLLDLQFTRFVRQTLIPGYFPAIGALMFGFGIKTVVDVNSWLSAAVAVCLVLMVYGVLMVLAGTREDRQDLLTFLRYVKTKFKSASARHLRLPG